MMMAATARTIEEMTRDGSKHPRVAFLLKSARRRRLESGEAIPGEFFYGYVQLQETGWDVALIEQDDLGVGLTEARAWTAVNRLSHALLGLNLRALWQLARARSRRQLNEFDRVVVAQNSLGFCLCLLHGLGIVKPRPVFIMMGGIDTEVRGVAGLVRRRLLKFSDASSLSRGEADALAACHGLRLHYIPFGVDTRFWTPDAANNDADDDYVLAIGNDPQRDYATLLAAWAPDLPRLKIVSRLVTGPVADNVEVIAGHYESAAITDADIRDLYRGARFVIIPVRETLQPSGQSACLQAMACGKAVILSDIEGLWDRTAMRDGETCVLVPPGDVEAMDLAVRSLLSDPAYAATIGLAARQATETQLDVSVMTEAVAALCRRGEGSEP